MIKVNLHGNYESVSINAMIDSGATEAFIHKRICDKHQITTKMAEGPREIYLADGNLSEMGSITHIVEVPMEIGGHKELATLQVANLQNHEIILGMPWLRGHNPKIDWEEQKITFDSERCITVHGQVSNDICGARNQSTGRKFNHQVLGNTDGGPKASS